jgi:hypothetical protein
MFVKFIFLLSVSLATIAASEEGYHPMKEAEGALYLPITGCPRGHDPASLECHSAKAAYIRWVVDETDKALEEARFFLITVCSHSKHNARERSASCELLHVSGSALRHVAIDRKTARVVVSVKTNNVVGFIGQWCWWRSWCSRKQLTVSN